MKLASFIAWATVTASVSAERETYLRKLTTFETTHHEPAVETANGEELEAFTLPENISTSTLEGVDAQCIETLKNSINVFERIDLMQESLEKLQSHKVLNEVLMKLIEKRPEVSNLMSMLRSMIGASQLSTASEQVSIGASADVCLSLCSSGSSGSHHSSSSSSVHGHHSSSSHYGLFDKILDKKEAIGDKLADKKEAIGDKLADKKDYLESKKSAIGSKLEDKKEAIGDKLADKKEAIGDKLADKKEAIGEKLADKKDYLESKKSAIGSKLEDKKDYIRSKLSHSLSYSHHSSYSHKSYSHSGSYHDHYGLVHKISDKIMDKVAIIGEKVAAIVDKKEDKVEAINSKKEDIYKGINHKINEKATSIQDKIDYINEKIEDKFMYIVYKVESKIFGLEEGLEKKIYKLYDTLYKVLPTDLAELIIAEIQSELNEYSPKDVQDFFKDLVLYFENLGIIKVASELEIAAIEDYFESSSNSTISETPSVASFDFEALSQLSADIQAATDEDLATWATGDCDDRLKYVTAQQWTALSDIQSFCTGYC